MVNNNNNNIWQTACVTAGCQSRAGTCWACLNCQVNLGLSSSVSWLIRAEDPVDLSADPVDLSVDTDLVSAFDQAWTWNIISGTCRDIYCALRFPPSILFCIANIEVSAGGVGLAKSHRDFVKDFIPQQEAFYPVYIHTYMHWALADCNSHSHSVFDAIFSRFSPLFNFFPAP